MLGAIIGAGSSLLGGIFGRNSEKKAIRAQNEYNRPINARIRLEEAGLNPATFYAPGSDAQTATGGTNYMGQAVADAGMLLGDAINKKSAEKRVSQLQAHAAKLQKQVDKMTLRPTVPGVYGQRAAQAASAGAATAAIAASPITDAVIQRPVQWNDPEMQGPVAPVKVFNPMANKWAYIHPGIAKRLELVEGDVILAEDYEAIMGDVGSEFLNTPNSINELSGNGVALYNWGDPFMKIKEKGVAGPGQRPVLKFSNPSSAAPTAPKKPQKGYKGQRPVP